jgi:outer membrane protein assembly factor BamE (lipoprotein component of BamABCDE complex)
MKTKMILSAFVPVIAAFAMGCATVGQEFATEHVNDVRVGSQTKDQIKSWFGEPFMVTTMSGSPKGCVESWMYKHAHAAIGAKATAQVLVVNFDDKNLVCDTAYSEVK